MRTTRIALALAALGLLAAGPAAADAGAYDPSKLVTPPLRQVKPVDPARFQLRNGITVFLLEDHDLPVVRGAAYVVTSPDWVPAERAGLGRVTGEVMRSGGSARHGGDWLDDRLAAIGASIQTGISTDFANASFRCLAENADEVVGLFAEVLREPAFPDEKLELSKVGMRREIAGRNDEMIPLLFRTAQQAVYGKDSPYARQAEYATLEPITRAEALELHGRTWEPGRLVLAVYGDFRSAAMRKLLAARFGDWRGRGVALPPAPPLPEPGPARLVFAPKEDVTQSGIVLTHLGFRADDPDYPAMDVLQTALGGGFQSRLINRIRSGRGLAYSTGARAGEGYLRPGNFLAYSLTRSDSTLTALDLLREEVRRVTEEPFTAAELKTAKESAQNQFVFNFEQPADVLFRAAYYQAIGYPQDFLERYQRGLETVSAESVLEAAKRKVHPERLIAVVVGKEKDFDRALETAGLPVERVDISIPPPPSRVAAGEATPAALKQGGEWLEQAAKLAGGSAAWAGVKAVAFEQEGTLSMQGQTIAVTSTVTWQLPDRYLAVNRLPFGELKQGSDGKAGWMAGMGQVQDSPDVAQGIRERYERSLFRLFAKPGEVAVQALPEPRTADGRSYRVALVRSDLVKDWVLWFDEEGRLARMEYVDEGPQGPARHVEVLSDWRALDGLQYPHASVTLLDDKPFMESKVVSAKLNPEVEPTAFAKPAP